MAARNHLTYSSAVLLQTVAAGCRYGFDIMDVSGLPSGTVYPALRRLQKQGYVTSEWEEDIVAQRAKRPRRRYYEISGAGRGALASALQRFRMLRPLNLSPAPGGGHRE